MKRAFAILACLCVLAVGEYYAISKWAIRHETLNLFDKARQRPVSVDLAVRPNNKLKPTTASNKLPTPSTTNGNTARTTDSSSRPTGLPARGNLVASFSRIYRPIRP